MGSLYGPTEIFMKANLNKIPWMDLATTLGTTEGSTQENGKTIKCTEKESLFGLIIKSISVTMKAIKKMDTASSIGLTAKCIKACGKTANSTEKESWFSTTNLKYKQIGRMVE